ncbi:MAG: hypothetical protein ACO1O6_11945 [Bacteroidota bacterium]
MDQKGALLVFVNGYTRGCEPLKPYWTEKGTQFPDAAALWFDIPELYFVNGEGRWYSTAESRFRNGWQYAEAQMHTFKGYREICFVSHSMGAAFAEGMAFCLMQQGLKVSRIVHFSVADAESLRIPSETLSINRIQLEMQGDRTLQWKNRFKWKPSRMIPGVNHYGLLKTDIRSMHPQVSSQDQQKWDFHYDTKTFGVIWDYVRELEKISLSANPDGSFTLDKSANQAVFLALLWERRLLNLDEQQSTEKTLLYR